MLISLHERNLHNVHIPTSVYFPTDRKNLRYLFNLGGLTESKAYGKIDL